MSEPTAPAPEPATGFLRRHPVLVYSAMRLALLGVVWLLLDVFTPLPALMTVALALLLSGAVSFLLLDRQRSAMSVAVGGFFRRIDDRIERSKVAEDDDADLVGPPVAGATGDPVPPPSASATESGPVGSGSPTSGGQRVPGAEEQAEQQQQA